MSVKEIKELLRQANFIAKTRGIKPGTKAHRVSCVSLDMRGSSNPVEHMTTSGYQINWTGLAH